MADDTAKAIVSDPEKFKAFLDTQSRLDRYSAVNALLIFKQLPEASQLKNFDDWSKDTIDEATAYTGIGRDKLYEMTSQEKCPFVLWVGNRRMIKRRVFDEYIEKMYSI